MNERLREWLRFDPARVPDVEEAYRQFIRHSKPGVAFCIAFAGAFIVAASVAVWLMLHGWSQQRVTGPIFVVFGAIFYSVLFLSIARSPLPVLGRVLAGAASLPRSCALAFAFGVLCVVIEIAGLLALVHLWPVQQHAYRVDLFGGGVLFSLAMMVMAAPLMEEFLMQGWLQTRAQRLGPFWAGVVTTIAFVLMHVPTSVFDLARGVGLGTAAWFRGTTRSMLACIIVHAANNSIIAAILLAARAGTQHR